jgi:hypothetical protein
MPSNRDVAEEIAAVVADLRAGRFAVANPRLSADIIEAVTDRLSMPQPVVDATGIYRGLLDRAESAGINIYEDFPQVLSPWEQVMVCYVNVHGNVYVLQTLRRDWQPGYRWKTVNGDVEWDRVRWVVEATVWVGGLAGGRPIPTSGPMLLMQHAVYDDGGPADLHWQQLTVGKHRPEVWEMPTAVLNAAFNFVSCSNVEIAEPVRPRPVRRRLDRFQVGVQTIVVRPPGKRTRHADSLGVRLRPVDELDRAVTVRGGFKEYGPKYGKGLLFGRHETRIWVQQHIRGGRAGDEPPPRDYLLRPGAGSA